MNDTRETFRDRLIELEQTTPALRAKYEKEMKAVFEQKLTKPRKVALAASGVMGIGFLMLFGTLAIIAPAEFPLPARLTFAAGAAFGLAWAILAGMIIRRGSFRRIAHSKAFAGLVWGIVVIVAIAAMLLGNEHPSIVGVTMLCSALVFLVGAGVGVVASRIEQSEVRTRGKLLELELRLAELAEKLPDKK